MNIVEPIRYESDITRLRNLGWTCRWSAQRLELPNHIHLRYPLIPLDYLSFVSSLEEFSSANEKQWFISVADFAGTNECAFAWNEWERLSLDSADGDDELISVIQKFWDGHIPIHFDVSEGYAFHALRVFDGSGAVVARREPEFEVVEVIAASFSEFLSRIV